jgi:hypothetical protein
MKREDVHGPVVRRDEALLHGSRGPGERSGPSIYAYGIAREAEVDPSARVDRATRQRGRDVKRGYRGGKKESPIAGAPDDRAFWLAELRNGVLQAIGRDYRISTPARGRLVVLIPRDVRDEQLDDLCVGRFPRCLHRAGRRCDSERTDHAACQYRYTPHHSSFPPPVRNVNEPGLRPLG